jgi:hypothetical protein
VRITFDDGDFEDFDKDCVVEGLELYKKYEDQDPNPEGFVAPVAAAAAGATTVDNGSNDDDDDGELEFSDDGEMDELAKK